MNRPLTPEEFDRIAAAVAAAERQTAGEIRVVVSTGRHGDAGLYPAVWGALAALAAPWPVALAVDIHPFSLLALQATVFVLVAALLQVPALARRAVPPGVRRDAIRAVAFDQFLAQGMHQTRDRTGVLIYVASLERAVEIIADEGIDSQVEQGAWNDVCAAVIAGARKGRLADGLVEAVARAGRLLAAHVPPGPGDTNEISDRVVVL